MIIDEQIIEYVESKIIPQYRDFDKAHNIEHITRVIANSLELLEGDCVDEVVNPEMVYVIAAYHDIGMPISRENHHIESGKILQADKQIQKWFSDKEIIIMKEAIEDHRASAKTPPRSIYGRIIAEADRDIDAESIFSRAILYVLEHHPDLTKEEQWLEFNKHMDEKYGYGGYLKLYISGSKNAVKLDAIRKIIADKPRLKAIAYEMLNRYMHEN